MSIELTTELYVHPDQLTGERVRRILFALFDVGFLYDPPIEEIGEGGAYWLDEDWHYRRPLAEALDAFDRARDWAIELWCQSPVGDGVDLKIRRSDADGSSNLERVGLSMPVSSIVEEGVVPLQFLGWSRFLAELTHPVWGRSDLDISFEFAPVDTAAIAATAVPPVHWMNVFGRPYVERLGMQSLLAAPAWRTEILANGSIAVTLAPSPSAMSDNDSARFASNLRAALAGR
jgi:hypothetical protein